MPLTIIKGPPNSGRTELVRERYAESLSGRPILVVPSTDDIFDWERRLAADDGAFLGNRIMHFKDLVAEVLGVPSGQGPGVASGLQRRHLVERAFFTSWPRIADRIDRQPGLIDAMLDLIDEFRNGLINVDNVELRAAADPSGFLGEVAGVYRCYLDLLASSGLTDNPAMAMEAAGVPLQKWQGRPVFVAGFDDLTNQQLELLVRLAEETEVTIAITHEVGNPAMAVTQKLLDRLLAKGAVEGPATGRPERSADHKDLLFEIQRKFLREDAEPIVPVPIDPDFSEGDTGDVFNVMSSSGRRGEAEAVAGEIARLVAGGISPGEIAIAVTSPATDGTIFRDLLADYGIPVTLESETPAASAATGQAILSLLRAGSGGSAADLVSFLRGPVGQDPGQVDRLEAELLRDELTSAVQAAKRFEKLTGSPPPFWFELMADDGSGTSEIVAAMAERLGENVLAADRSAVPDSSSAMETQMATAISRACREIEKIQGGASAADIADAINSGAIKTWAIPARNTVRIASPYSLRAKRFEHLFMVSLQERGFGDADRSGPFLTAEARESLELPEFTDPELQELYLFYSCLSVPTRGLWLSSRVADEEGKAEQPSPLVAAVEGLFDESGIVVRRTGRSSSAITFDPERAPSLTELTRSLAAEPDNRRAGVMDALDLEDLDVPSIDAAIDRAFRIEESTRVLAPVTDPAARERLEADDTFSATAIEAFLGCPYRWFIEKALRPNRFGPDPEPMTRGNLVHLTMARLYRDRTGIPRPDDVNEWIADAEVLVGQVASERSIRLGTDSAGHRTARRQVTNAIAGFLRFESERESPGFLPFQLEATFGLPDGQPALQMEAGWKLRGSIDRIDVSGTGEVGRRGIVIDYKTGESSVKSFAQITREKKVQLQLYMYAALKVWGIEPTAGLYVPILRKVKGPRGLVDLTFASDVADLDHQKKDRVEDIRAEIDAAIELADDAVVRMRAGDIEHDPATCPNHLNHAAVPDWIADAEGSNQSESER